MIAATGVAITFFVAFTSLYLRQQRALKMQQAQVELSQSGRVALDVMVRDLRSIGRNPQAINGLAGFLTGDCQSLTFTLDLNGDGDVTDNDEQVGFRRTGSNLEMYRLGTIAWTPIASWLQPIGGSGKCTGNAAKNPIFTFLKADGTDITTDAMTATSFLDVNRIVVTLPMQRTISGLGTIRQTEAAVISPRNLS
jgi:hypothetical protein